MVSSCLAKCFEWPGLSACPIRGCLYLGTRKPSIAESFCRHCREYTPNLQCVKAHNFWAVLVTKAAILATRTAKNRGHTIENRERLLHGKDQSCLARFYHRTSREYNLAEFAPSSYSPLNKGGIEYTETRRSFTRS